MNEEKKSIEITDNEFFSIESNSNLVIAFDKIFNKEKLSVFNKFELGAKRNFKLISNLICETYSEIFIDPETMKIKESLTYPLLQILNAQSRIMKEQSMSKEVFYDLLKNIITSANNALMNEIDSFVNNGYELNLESEKSKKNKNADYTQTFISNEYGVILIKIAYLDRIMIPIISQYLLFNKASFIGKTIIVQDSDDDQENMEFNEINQDIFNFLFKFVAKENTENIQNKLYKLVYSRIMREAASAKHFWKIANNLGITKESASLEIYMKLISNSIPKIILAKELNFINFFSTIIMNQIKFLFSNKFKVHYQIVNPKNTSGSMFESNEENMTELEKMDIRMSRKNEGSMIIKDIIAAETVNKLDELLDVSVTNEEISNILKYIKMNPIQEKIISLITFKYFKSTDAIKRLTAYEYAKVLLCCVKYLEKQKYILIPKIILSNCIKQRDRMSITGNKIKTKIESTKKYKELISVKYSEFSDEAEKCIQSLISTIYNSSFIDEKGNDIFESSAKIGNIAEEIVNICFLI